jgi:acetyl-CoA carboxylase biotin carboxylase subunit
MKLVKNEKELDSALSLTKQEAKKYFANDEVYIEKYIEKPRHIEVQILSDTKTTIHMGERDCTVQRKHQKLIEESPSPVLKEKTRQDLLNRTVQMVSKLNYEGAGTVEFIYDNGKFFFIEMNTRIQVEHPVSEIRGGIDIVKEQIKIASKGKTSLKQSDITFRGHVIECRINAEDPSKDFLPSPGTINAFHQPSGFRTRVDGAIFQGCKITPYYDSLICKLICQGRDREEAIQRLQRSLSEFVIEGIATTIDLHKKILSHKKFINSDFDVNWLAKENFY